MRRSTAEARGLKPLAMIVGHATHAQEPGLFTTAPVGAIAKLYRRRPAGTTRDVDLFEINEAFAVVTMAAMKEHDIPHDKRQRAWRRLRARPSDRRVRRADRRDAARRAAQARQEPRRRGAVHRRRRSDRARRSSAWDERGCSTHYPAVPRCVRGPRRHSRAEPAVPGVAHALPGPRRAGFVSLAGTTSGFVVHIARGVARALRGSRRRSAAVRHRSLRRAPRTCSGSPSTRSRSHGVALFTPRPPCAASGRRRLFRTGLMTTVLNPEGRACSSLALFPQFVDPAHGIGAAAMRSCSASRSSSSPSPAIRPVRAPRPRGCRAGSTCASGVERARCTRLCSAARRASRSIAAAARDRRSALMLLSPEQAQIRDDAARVRARRARARTPRAWDREHRVSARGAARLGALGAIGIVVPETVGRRRPRLRFARRRARGNRRRRRRDVDDRQRAELGRLRADPCVRHRRAERRAICRRSRAASCSAASA